MSQETCLILVRQKTYEDRKVLKARLFLLFASNLNLFIPTSPCNRGDVFCCYPSDFVWHKRDLFFVTYMIFHRKQGEK